MRIAIKDIKLSPYQVRDLESDPDLAALAESIEEHDQLVPIKVRPSDGGYECIFGHRRLAAMEMAGFDEIEAIVSDVDDQEAQIQALIENTQRKDLEPIELARSLKALKDATGWSGAEIGRRGIVSERTTSRMLALLDEPSDVQKMVVSDTGHARQPGERLTPMHIDAAREVLGEVTDRAKILRKAGKERLTSDQTRKLAQRYESAPTAELKARILEVPAKKQEALEVIREDLEKAEERAERIRPPMTVTDYWGKVQAVEQQVKKLVLAARQVEVWQSGTWPLIEGCFERIVSEIEGLLQEVESA